jgi:hypothetical protein
MPASDPTPCRVFATEYESFQPAWYLTAGLSGPSPQFYCDQDHIGASYTALQSSDVMSFTSFTMDGTAMGSMTGGFPLLDPGAPLTTIQVTNAQWITAMPVFQYQDFQCTNNPSYYGHADSADCDFVPEYPSLVTFSLVNSIRPTSADGLTFAVYPGSTGGHIGDWHGYTKLANFDLSSNRLKGDLPNVDDPDTDHNDNLQVLKLNSNSFGYGGCFDRSCAACLADLSSALCMACPIDCIPPEYSYYHQLTGAQ